MKLFKFYKSYLGPEVNFSLYQKLILRNFRCPVHVNHEVYESNICLLVNHLHGSDVVHRGHERGVEGRGLSERVHGHLDRIVLTRRKQVGRVGADEGGAESLKNESK